MEQVLTLYERPADPNCPRLCFDERPCQLLNEVIAPLPMQPDKPTREDNEYVRQGTAVVLLAYDLDSGQRYTQTRKQRTKKDYAEFINEIVMTHYTHCKQVDLVQDNLNTHKYGSFYEHLPLNQARQLTQKVVFHFTPKHGSWLNIAEIEFSALARQCLDRRIGSLSLLTEQVRLWTLERNERSIQVHWSFTVAAATTTLKSWYEKVNPTNKPDEAS